MQYIMPVLWEVEQKCKQYNELHKIAKTNYIIEILSKLEVDHATLQKQLDKQSSDIEMQDEFTFYE